MPHLLYAHAAIASANLLLILAHFPARPPTPPSVSQLQSKKPGPPQALGGMWDVLSNRNYLLCGQLLVYLPCPFSPRMV